MKVLIVSLLVVALSVGAAYAGNCEHSWQTAADGSRCGDRAADVRPGGN
jgi:hypothetical protein